MQSVRQCGSPVRTAQKNRTINNIGQQLTLVIAPERSLVPVGDDRGTNERRQPERQSPHHVCMRRPICICFVNKLLVHQLAARFHQVRRTGDFPKDEASHKGDFPMFDNRHICWDRRIRMDHGGPHQQFRQRMPPQRKELLGGKSITGLVEKFESDHQGKRSVFGGTDRGGQLCDELMNSLRPGHDRLIDRTSGRRRFFQGRSRRLSDQTTDPRFLGIGLLRPESTLSTATDAFRSSFGRAMAGLPCFAECRDISAFGRFSNRGPRRPVPGERLKEFGIGMTRQIGNLSRKGKRMHRHREPVRTWRKRDLD